MTQQLVVRNADKIRKGDRIKHPAGSVVIVNWVEETLNSWKIGFTYEAARVTSDYFFVSKDARHALPVRRYETVELTDAHIDATVSELLRDVVI